MCKKMSLICVVLLASFVGSVFAGGGLFYNNSGDRLWMVDGNWENGLPTASFYEWSFATYAAADVNGPVVQSGDTAVAGNLVLGYGGFGDDVVYMEMTGGSLDITNDFWIGKDDGQWNPEAPGVLNISGGDLAVGGTGILGVSSGASGTINQTGGTVTVNYYLVLDWLETSNPEYGVYNLHGGVLDIGNISVREHGSIDIESGVLTMPIDLRWYMTDLVNSGQLTGYGGKGIVLYDFDDTTPGKLTTWAEVRGGFKLNADVGWDIFSNVGYDYRYGPSFIINDDGSIDMWTAAPGSEGEWDWIRHKKSTDGGHSWGSETVALRPTPGSVDAYAVCDPGVIKFGGYYYIGYTSTTNSGGVGIENDTFVARSTSPTGPYDKWNGSGWGGNPQPIIEYTDDPNAWGCGEPSFVVKDGLLYIYYTWNNGIDLQTRVATADATNANWPLGMTFHGVAIQKETSHSDSSDVKYVDAVGKFIAVNTASRFTDQSHIQVWTSSDGLTFTRTGEVRTNILPYCHNIGISGDESGHINSNEPHFIAYAYGEVWGNWSTYLNPVTICDTDYAMDFNFNCVVNLFDLADFATEWQESISEMDFDENGIVDFGDFAVFSLQWLEDTRID